MKKTQGTDTVTGRTRAGADGKLIERPCCHDQTVEDHFSWCALDCGDCQNVVEKLEWLIAE